MTTATAAMVIDHTGQIPQNPLPVTRLVPGRPGSSTVHWANVVLMLVHSVSRRPIKHRTFKQCCFNGGPQSVMSDQHWNNIGSVCPVKWHPNPSNRTFYDNVGLMLGRCLRRWPNIKPTLIQCIMLIGKPLFWIKPGSFLGQWWLNVGTPSSTSCQH